jgi:uncharacterized protein
MGDDAQNEYIYKFVTKARYRKGMNGDALDEGTLYVARFNEDGSGDWLALDIKDPDFQAPRPRPASSSGPGRRAGEHPVGGRRGRCDQDGPSRVGRGASADARGLHDPDQQHRRTVDTDAANPRPRNATGHIIRWREQGNRSFATKFEWDIFVLPGRRPTARSCRPKAARR